MSAIIVIGGLMAAGFLLTGSQPAPSAPRPLQVSRHLAGKHPTYPVWCEQRKRTPEIGTIADLRRGQDTTFVAQIVAAKEYCVAGKVIARQWLVSDFTGQHVVLAPVAAKKLELAPVLHCHVHMDDHGMVSINTASAVSCDRAARADD